MKDIFLMKNIIFNRKTTVSILVVMLVICALPLASGMYLYRLVTDEGILTRKLTLLR